jgi:hypothetical protein
MLFHNKYSFWKYGHVIYFSIVTIQKYADKLIIVK